MNYYWPLVITLTPPPPRDLKDVNPPSKVDVYALVTMNDDPQTNQAIPVVQECGSNPKWSCAMKFAVAEAAAKGNLLNLMILIGSDRHRGEVVVPIKKIIDCRGKVFVCNVRLPNGEVKGTLNLCCKIGEKISVPVAAPSHVTEKAVSTETPAMVYPAVGSSAGYQPSPAAPAGCPCNYPAQGPYPYNYPAQGPYPYNYPAQGPYPSNYPAQGPYPSNYQAQGPYPYNYPAQGPPPPGYGGYVPSSAQGYGYPGHPPYGGPLNMPAQQPAARLGLGLPEVVGRFVLGGLLFGAFDDGGGSHI